MAKKARRSGKSGAKSKPAAKGARKAAGSKRAGKGAGGPRSVALPGMAKVRNQRLDNLCEAIAEDRRTMASARADEVGSIQAALREMKVFWLGAYKHAGVELAFVAGEDKLRVRLTKDAEDSSQTLEAGTGDGSEQVGSLGDAGAGGDLGDDPDGDGEI